MGSDKNSFLTGLTCRTNRTGQGFSEGNGIFQKDAKGVFGEKRLLGGWG